jgi:hypothetical protein
MKISRFANAVALTAVLASALTLGACSKGDAPKTEAAAEAPKVVLPAPKDNDPAAWKEYFRQELKPHINARYRRPYSYFIPAPIDEGTQQQFDLQLENVQNAIGRGVQAGSMLAFAGPDSAKVGDVIVESFKLAGPKSLKGVRVVVIATADQQERIQAAIAPSEADFIFVDMK